MSLFAKAADFENSSFNSALCTVVEVRGSTPRKVGAKMIVVDDHEPMGLIVGTIGGGAIEHLIRGLALESIRLQKPRLVSTSLRNELGMCCGGEMTIFIEPIVKKSQFICFGAGHISQALCPLAAHLGYEVSVVDERSDLLANVAFATAKNRFTDPSHFSFKDMPFSFDTYVVIATHDHELDQKIVEGVLSQTFKYGALVGSSRKALMTKKRLLAKGFLIDAITRIICPAGLNIYASTPTEIAVSIAAQMTMVKNESSEDRRADRRSGREQAHGFI